MTVRGLFLVCFAQGSALDERGNQGYAERPPRYRAPSSEAPLPLARGASRFLSWPSTAVTGSYNDQGLSPGSAQSEVDVRARGKAKALLPEASRVKPVGPST
jgi:hypothetical protein